MEWTHKLTADHYEQSMSFLHVARYTEVCMNHCRLHYEDEINSLRPAENLNPKELRCIDECMERVSRIQRNVETQMVDGLKGLFENL